MDDTENERLRAIETQLKRGDGRMSSLKDNIDSVRGEVGEMRAELRKNTALTEDIGDILAGLKIGIKVIKWLGSAGGTIIALYTAAKQFHWWGM